MTTVYDSLAESYEQGMARITALHAPAMVRALRLQPGDRVLDMAAGTGAVSEALALAVGPHGLVVAADISAAMLNAARRRLGGGRPAPIAYARMAAESPALADHTFDAVCCAFGVMHFAEPDAALRAMCRVLRPGGRCAVAVWAPVGQRIQSPVEEAFAALAGKDARSPDDEGFAAPGVLVGALERAGFLNVGEALSEAVLAVRDLDDWWTTITSGRLGVRIQAHGPERAAWIRAEAYARAERFGTRTETGWHFPAGALLAAGVAP